MHLRTLIYVAVPVALTGAGFGAGYWLAEWRSSAQMEDYALSNVLGDVGTAAFIAKGDIPKARDLIDLNLNDHLTHVRQYQGSVKDDQFEASKIRTLNAAARLWDERPPFAAISNSSTPGTELWLPEWRDITAENMKLLDWAKGKCASNSSLKCATGPVGR